MIPYINEITNCSNLFPKPKILKQIDNDTLLIAPSPLSNPSNSYLIQNIKGVNNILYYIPPKYSTDLNTTNLTNNIEYPYVFVNYTSSIKYYCGFNIYFRDESYTESHINATLTITEGSNEFIIPIRSNEGGYIQLYENINNPNGYRFGIKLTILSEFDPAEVNHVIQFGICNVYEQQFFLKNFESTIQLYSLPFDNPHGISIIKQNYSDIFNYLPTIDKSVHIVLYQNHSDNNVIEKSLEVLNYYDGNFTYHGSVLSPNLVINDPLVLKSNYLEIKELKRYYYITDIETLGKDNFRVYLQVDTLMTYKEFIYKQGAYVLRNEYDFNTLFFDNRIPLKSIPIIETYYSNSYPFLPFKQTFDSDNKIKYREILSSNSYCVLITCNSSIYTSRDGGLPNEVFDTNFQGFYCGTMLYCLRGQDISNIYQIIVNASDIGNLFENKSQYILSFQFFPFDITKHLEETDITLTSTIRCGNRDNIDLKIKVPDGDNTTLSFNVYRINKPKCIVLNFNQIYIKFKNYNKFIYNNINSQIFLPFYGYSDIDINAFYNGTDGFEIYVKYYISLDGSCDIHISKTATGMPIHIISFKISEDISFTQTNSSDIKRNMFLSGLNLITGSIISGVTGIPSQTKLDLLEGRATKRTTPKTRLGSAIELQKSEIISENISKGVNLVSSSTNDIVKGFNNKLNGGSITSTYSKLYSSYEQTCFVIIKYNEPDIDNLDNNLKYNHYMGRPLNKYRELKDVRGYTEIGAIHLDELDNALTQEKDEIEEYLKNGVYFPQKESGS